MGKTAERYVKGTICVRVHSVGAKTRYQILRKILLKRMWDI